MLPELFFIPPFNHADHHLSFVFLEDDGGNFWDEFSMMEDALNGMCIEDGFNFIQNILWVVKELFKS